MDDFIATIRAPLMDYLTNILLATSTAETVARGTIAK